MELITCHRCGRNLPFDSYYRTIALKRGYSQPCKGCKYLLYKDSRSKSNYNEWARRYRLRESNKNYEREFRIKYLTSFSGWVSKLLSAAKSRAKDNDLEFDLTTEWLSKKLKPMLCEATGIELTLLKYKNRTKRVMPFNPSIDRINPKGGYTQNNCRIVCWIFNLAKGQYEEDDLLKMCKAYIDKVNHQ